jgi:hypothetical protein
LDYCALRASPLWERGDISSEGGIINLVNEDTKESGSLLVGVMLELRANLDDERGGDSRKQASLMLW